jgi:alpha-L-fucosidase
VAEYEGKGWKIDHKRQTFGANTWDPSPNTFQEYLDNKAYPQVKELMDNYPDMKCLWYDMPWRMDAEQSFNFYKLVYDIQPQIIITDRIGNGFGDYSIPGDNKIPAKPDEMVKPWETVGTFNNSWGFNGYDQDWKSPNEILFWLIEIVSKGGNYMLNIGPTALGAVPAESVNNLEAVGKWMDVNGEALYGTTKWEITKEGPTKLEMGGTSAREKHGFNIEFTPQDFWFTQRGNQLYAIAMEYPENKVFIKSMCEEAVGAIKTVDMLGIEDNLEWKQTADGLEVIIGDKRVDKIGYVLKIGL